MITTKCGLELEASSSSLSSENSAILKIPLLMDRMLVKRWRVSDLPAHYSTPALQTVLGKIGAGGQRPEDQVLVLPNVSGMNYAKLAVPAVKNLLVRFPERFLELGFAEGVFQGGAPPSEEDEDAGIIVCSELGAGVVPWDRRYDQERIVKRVVGEAGGKNKSPYSMLAMIYDIVSAAVWNKDGEGSAALVLVTAVLEPFGKGGAPPPQTQTTRGGVFFQQLLTPDNRFPPLDAFLSLCWEGVLLQEWISPEFRQGAVRQLGNLAALFPEYVLVKRGREFGVVLDAALAGQLAGTQEALQLVSQAIGGGVAVQGGAGVEEQPLPVRNFFSKRLPKKVLRSVLLGVLAIVEKAAAVAQQQQNSNLREAVRHLASAAGVLRQKFLDTKNTSDEEHEFDDEAEIDSDEEEGAAGAVVPADRFNVPESVDVDGNGITSELLDEYFNTIVTLGETTVKNEVPCATDEVDAVAWCDRLLAQLG